MPFHTHIVCGVVLSVSIPSTGSAGCQNTIIVDLAILQRIHHIGYYCALAAAVALFAVEDHVAQHIPLTSTALFIIHARQRIAIGDQARFHARSCPSGRRFIHAIS